MPDVLSFDHYVDLVRSAAAALAESASSAGFGAQVPTCPGWTVAELVAHQGMVHRWAAANLRRDEVDVPSEDAILQAVPAALLLDWFGEGVQELLTALRTAAPDVAAMVFLNDAPAPRHFWARRQAHETGIHAVDAIAARLGRIPAAEEVGTTTDVALDGIDELLTGFFTRGRSELAEPGAFTIAVCPTDADRSWTLTVDQEGMTTQRQRAPRADVTFTGTAAQLYLGLWNRGAQITSSGRRDLLQRWHEVQHIRWR